MYTFTYIYIHVYTSVAFGSCTTFVPLPFDASASCHLMLLRLLVQGHPVLPHNVFTLLGSVALGLLLVQWPSDSSDDPAALHAEGEVDRAEQEVRATIMRQVLVRSSAPLEGKRRWMHPPMNSEPPPGKPRKPTPAEGVAKIATAIATAAAAAAAAAVASEIPAPRQWRKTPAPEPSPATPPSAAPPQQQHSGSKQRPSSGVQCPEVHGPRLPAQMAKISSGRFSVQRGQSSRSYYLPKVVVLARLLRHQLQMRQKVKRS